MSEFSETTDPGSLRTEMRYVRERCDEWNERQDVRLDRHGERITAVERGQWKAATVIGTLSALGAGLAAWFAVLMAISKLAATLKGG